jgi:phage-related tail protein
MTPFAKRCELEALVTERAGMESHDTMCANVEDFGDVYSEEDYRVLAARIRTLDDDSTVALDPTPVTCTDPCGCDESEELKGKLSAAQAEVASLQVLACTQRDSLGEANANVERLKRELADTRERLEASEHDAVMARAAERTARAEANQLLESRALWMARCERAEKAWDAAMSERNKRIAELEYRLRACGIEP